MKLTAQLQINSVLEILFSLNVYLFFDPKDYSTNPFFFTMNMNLYLKQTNLTNNQLHLQICDFMDSKFVIRSSALAPIRKNFPTTYVGNTKNHMWHRFYFT